MSKPKRKKADHRAEADPKLRPATKAAFGQHGADKRKRPEREGERPRVRASDGRERPRAQASEGRERPRVQAAEGRVRPRGHQAARGERALAVHREARGNQRGEARGKERAADEPRKGAAGKRASDGERAVKERGPRRDATSAHKRASDGQARNGAGAERAGGKHRSADRGERERPHREPRRDARAGDGAVRGGRALSQDRARVRGAASTKGGRAHERPSARGRERAFSQERPPAREQPAARGSRGREQPAERGGARGREQATPRDRERGREQATPRDRARGREQATPRDRARGREQARAHEGTHERPARAAQRARPALDAARPHKRLFAEATQTRPHAHKRPLAVAGPRVPKRAATATRAEPSPEGAANDLELPATRTLSGQKPLARKPRALARAPLAAARNAHKRPPADVAPVVKAREVSEEPHPGLFVLTTRVGSEQDLVDELVLLGVTDPAPRILAPALVLAPKVPKRDKRPVDLTFARQGFPIVQSVRSHDLEQTAARIARSLRGQLERAQHYALHVWVPDSDLGNPLSSLAEELEAKLAARLQEGLPEATRVDDASLRRLGSIPFAQVCLIDPERAVAGVTYSNAALSLAKGGRTRVRVTGEFPSRAARKLVEALAWLGVEPSAGDVCVDLGAAPGGWTYVLAERRARVIAVDPAKLKPEILAMKGVRHVQESAFTFAPESEVDWLFCDMAWRPLEAAALLAKWGRKHWARMLVANIKLPMKKKAELLARVRHILENEGGWKHVRTKQLYHDRDEITLTAHLG